MSAITTEPVRLRIPTAASIQAALAEPFERRVLKCKPGAVKGNQALAMPYLDARDVADRLDGVLGLDGWQDDYEQLADGPCSAGSASRSAGPGSSAAAWAARASSPMPATARKPRRVTPSSGRP